MNRKTMILKILSILFIVGGIVRLLAGKDLFEFFFMEALWSDHHYFIYIYRVLGAFVIFTGLILFVVSKNIKHFAPLFPALAIGFALTGMIMLLSGLAVELPLIFYLPDFVFCFIMAWFIYTFK
jgi:hypothetical protein